MQHQTPASKLQALVQVFQQFIAPYAQMLQAQGIGVDFQELFELIAKYGNMPEIKRILTFVGPSAEGEGPVGQPTRQAAVTERIQTRVNRPGATQRGMDEVLAQTLAKGTQGSQAETIGRMVG